MARKSSLGVEPYVGKPIEDPGGPIDANVKTEPVLRRMNVPDPQSWVQMLVGRAMRFYESMSMHPHTSVGSPMAKSDVLRRWILNGDGVLMNKAEADVVMEALQRSPADPVDPSETPSVRRDRDSALALTRARVSVRRAALTS